MRPTNITAIIIILLLLLKELVIPKLKPTVLYAEKHSNAMGMSPFSGSNIEMNIVAKPMTNNDNDMIANALRTDISEISRVKISILDFPFAILNIFKVAIAKVLVFIPPPVD